MSPEYLVLGIVLILMGGAQIWLRHGPGAAALKEREGGGEAGAQGRDVQPPLGAGKMRSGRVWEAWTGILGFVGIIFGIVLVVLGLLGR